jgi:hypothetical protein
MQLKACFYPHRYAYLWVKQRVVDRYLADAVNCRKVQRERLFTKIRRNADTAFGRDHGFSEILSIKDFRQRVPVANYEYYRPYVERVKQGEIEAMFGSGTNVLMFSMTSGTTNKPKYIPITHHFYKEYRESWNLWGRGVFRDHVDLVLKKTLQFTSDWRQFYTSGGIPCGNISGLSAETRPRIAKPAFLLPVELNKVSGTANKQYVAYRLALPRTDIGMIGTANPLTLVNFARLAEEHRETLIRDLHDGTLSDHVEIPDAVRQSLSPSFRRRHPRRARELERIIERTGHFYPRDFWPNLSVLAIWTGGPVAAYLPRVREYYGDCVFRDHGLSASEGHMTTPFRDNTSAGVLDYNTHYFEFIPEDEYEHQERTVLEAHELEEGKNYYLLLSTSNGLYRYDIHDVVRCVGFEGACPVLDFLHKGAHFSSMTGEKLSEYQVVQAIQAAFQDLSLSIEHFTLAPVPGDPPHYVLLIDANIDSDMEAKLARQANQRLSEWNCEYEDRLASRRLEALVVQRVPEGTFDAYRERFVQREGASSEQYKHPFLTTKTDFLDQLVQPVA